MKFILSTHLTHFPASEKNQKYICIYFLQRHRINRRRNPLRWGFVFIPLERNGMRQKMKKKLESPAFEQQSDAFDQKTKTDRANTTHKPKKKKKTVGSFPLGYRWGFKEKTSNSCEGGGNYHIEGDWFFLRSEGKRAHI